MVPRGRIERPSDDYKSTVLPLYYRGVWLREWELNPPIRLMRPESSHCFIPRYLNYFLKSHFSCCQACYYQHPSSTPGLFYQLLRTIIGSTIVSRLTILCHLLTNSFIPSSINLQPFSLRSLAKRRKVICWK